MTDKEEHEFTHANHHHGRFYLVRAEAGAVYVRPTHPPETLKDRSEGVPKSAEGEQDDGSTERSVGKSVLRRGARWDRGLKRAVQDRRAW